MTRTGEMNLPTGKETSPVIRVVFLFCCCVWCSFGLVCFFHPSGLFGGVCLGNLHAFVLVARACRSWASWR